MFRFSGPPRCAHGYIVPGSKWFKAEVDASSVDLEHDNEDEPTSGISAESIGFVINYPDAPTTSPSSAASTHGQYNSITICRISPENVYALIYAMSCVNPQNSIV